jgi:hypothetical protein
MTTELDLVHAAYISQANKLKNDVKRAMVGQSENSTHLASSLFYNILKQNNIEVDDKAKKYIQDR